MPKEHPRPWRTGSVFGAGKRRPLDREQRARFRFLLRAHTRAGRLPAKHEWVGEALLKRLGTDGQCDPAHATLASDAGCSSRTVRRATAVMRSLGLLQWSTRLVRSGWRTEQTSNSYELVPNAAPLPLCCGGQSGRETGSKIHSFKNAPNLGGSEEWGRLNAARQLASLLDGMAAQTGG